MEMEVQFMLLSFRTRGFKVFNEAVELNMIASNRIKNLDENTITFSNLKVLKSAIIYGPNNSGKSNLIYAIKVFQSLVFKGNLENFPYEKMKNYLVDDIDSIDFEIEFLDTDSNRIYKYGVEIFSDLKMNEYLFIDNNRVYERDKTQSPYGNSKYLEKFEIELLKNINFDTLFITTLTNFNTVNLNLIAINKFFKKLSVFDNTDNKINIQLMIDYLTDEKKKELFNHTLQLADMALIKREYIENEDINDVENTIKNIIYTTGNTEINQKQYKALTDRMKIMSIYQKKDGTSKIVPSLSDDSYGTNKFSSLVINIYKALLENNILIIDEIDNSLHHMLTKELINLMNSKANTKSQFIITSHDLKLLDSNLLRKDQVYLIDRKNYNVDLYSLKDFKANSETDTRSTTNYENLYESGRIGALPEPDLYQIIREFYKYDQGISNKTN